MIETEGGEGEARYTMSIGGRRTRLSTTTTTQEEEGTHVQNSEGRQEDEGQAGEVRVCWGG